MACVTETITLGIMVEVPSGADIIDHFCDEVDFFSIGSERYDPDLYAVDRNNPRVSPLYNPITPSFRACCSRLLPLRISGANG